MAIDIVQLILVDLLQISSSLLSEYSSIGDQLIYLILIPSVILLLFVYTFGGWISGGHPRFHWLITIVAYIFIIYSGWYGSYFVPIIVNWFMVILAAAFLFFIVTRIIHPARAPQLAKFTGELGKKIKGVTMGKSKERASLDDKIRDVNKAIKKLKQNYNAAAGNQYLQQHYKMQIDEYTKLLKELKAKRGNV